MRLIAVLLITAALAPLAASAPPPPTIPNDEAAIAHALNRLAFGPRPGDIARLQQQGLAAWIEQQLQPSHIGDAALAARLARLETLRLDPETLAREVFAPARRARQARQAAAGEPRPPESAEAASSSTAPARSAAAPAGDVIRREREVFVELSEAKLLRAVYSERQLEEVLVDFWFNHFNVFARKAIVGLYVGEYERKAIRPHVLGRFRDLLGVTAKSPAMLVYLDNWQSIAPGERLQAMRARTGGNGAARGLNENYARELLELHTLGVDGGYTQDDIVHVARAFTGWTIARPSNRGIAGNRSVNRGGASNRPGAGRGRRTPTARISAMGQNDGEGFRFVPALHDRGAKTVLGRTLPSDGGQDDGERVLDLLAAHPATAWHLSLKLAQRFVSDTPPPALVDRAAATFTRTGGDLREVVRTIITSPEFFDPSVRAAKVKTPFEYVASALRAADADVQSGVAIVRALADMGMPLYLCQPPTGYDETAEAWVSSAALVSRINFAVALAEGRVRGVRLPAGTALDPLALGSADFQKQ